MDESIEIIITEDGSHSLKNTELDETYHSIHGAIQESEYVFIKAGLEYVLQKGQEQISILEIGFGTGLNAFLTFLHQNNASIDYTTIEAFPIPEETYLQLNYARRLKADPKNLMALHEAKWDQQMQISSGIKLKKIEGKIQDTSLPPNYFDLVYFDAFAPAKQPEMWELEIFEKIAASLKPGGILVTYCAKADFKRNLKFLDFEVESLPGPPWKFEMVRALKT